MKIFQTFANLIVNTLAAFNLEFSIQYPSERFDSVSPTDCFDVYTSHFCFIFTWYSFRKANTFSYAVRKRNVFRSDVTVGRELFIRTELLLSFFAFIHCFRLFTIWKLNHGSELLLNVCRIRNLFGGGQSRFSCRTHSNLEIIRIVSSGEQARRR